ncbi:transcriptional regulator family: Fungal Specific TF [Paecilomyces variotii]|nr:transcriptional regulator family: Fungal Specific TF [Paecilomyces variotii]
MEHRPGPGPAVRTASNEAVRQRPKQQRAAQACERCRFKKYKCDEQYPCSRCRKSKRECVYAGDYHQRESSRSASYIRELEDKVAALTSQLQIIQSQRDHPSDGAPTSMETASDPDINAILTPRSSERRAAYTSSPSPMFNDVTSESLDEEISGVNEHTNSIEFYGNSSSAAFLGYLQNACRPQLKEYLHHGRAADSPSSLISTLHNPGFSLRKQTLLPRHQNFYFEQAHVFMEGYFENLNLLHPLIDKEDFSARVHDLWFGRDRTPEPSFLALYLSLLSLGALTRVWDESQLSGMTRFEWSRKLFSEAQMCLKELGFSNDLETVQCLYLMSKICQNELNPNLAYMYLGLAIRTCLSAGFNRETRDPKSQHSQSISRMWWGLYSLEIEMSFALGRPDTLGMDEYHNRILPERDDSEYAIVTWMVDFARIIRRVSVKVYHSKAPLQDKLQLSSKIERQLDAWLSGLPHKIRPDVLAERQSFTSLKDPKWARRQRLVLCVRYHNVKMLLFRPFLAHAARNPEHTSAELEAAVSKCLSSAEKTIDIIHDTYTMHTFFRCWWYNVTYVMFATAIILLRITTIGPSTETDRLVGHVHKAVEILAAMDESIVARRSIEIINHHLREIRASAADSVGNTHIHDQSYTTVPQADPIEMLLPELRYGLGLPDYTFEAMAGLFDNLSDFPIMNEQGI